ncbi:MAG: hypothetical protein M3Q19_06390 [Pseudomonadota bacterium]|nr:hypothetical protein [Pseudomonadota bacterium]
MSSYSTRASDKLFHLLPSYIRELDGPSRIKDDDPPGPLQALLRVIEQQADALDADIVQLMHDAFIETCEPWAIPYLGDLVGSSPLFDESRIRDGDDASEIFGGLTGPSFKPVVGLGNRADVAKTIYYRRRKGTVPMLEELARDVTGWPAHVVEFFQCLQWSQWVRNHVRMEPQTAELRSVERLDQLGGAFDPFHRSVDVRPIGVDEGWHNIRNIGIFLWRLQSHRMEAIDARRQGAAGDYRWRFSPLGQDAPLFSARRREDRETGLTEREHIPQAISRPTFHGDLRRALSQPTLPDFSEYYGLFDPSPGMVLAEGRSMMIFVDGTPVPLSRIRCRNLDKWDQPSGHRVALDVATGRIALGPGLLPAGEVTVYFHHGFPGDLGGGPYRRRAWLIKSPPDCVILNVDGSGAPATFATIGAALAEWSNRGKPNCIIRIQDNRTYSEGLSIEPADGRFIALEAADRMRPHLILPRPLAITGEHDESSVTLGGLLIEGRVEITGSLGELRIIHSTLVPAGSIAVPDPAAPPQPVPPVKPSITVAEKRADGSPANTELNLLAAFAVLGALRIPAHAERLVLLDSIVDGSGIAAVAGPAANSYGAPARIERSTLRGPVRARQIDLGSNSIFDGLVLVERQQTGCMRFSYVPEASLTPRRYRCQPDLAVSKALEVAPALTPAEVLLLRQQIAARVQPEYSSEAYGQPAYLQLHRHVAEEVATGAEDGSEMGAWCHLKQPQRAANLRLRLQEYLPFGLDAGLIPVT